MMADALKVARELASAINMLAAEVRVLARELRERRERA